MLIGILITAFGILAGVVTIFCIFFQVKNPIKITKRDMGFIIIWLILMFLGISNLYYIHIRNNNNVDQNEQSSDIIETESQDMSSSTELEGNEKIDTDNVDTSLSEDEQFIQQNLALIQQLKGEYSDKDIKIIENDSIKFCVFEIAGFIYQNMMKTGEFEILQGEYVSSTKVIILDYLSDDIIYTYTSQGYYIDHFPGNQDKFYCIVLHGDYDIYVSPPIQAIGGEKYNVIDICLNKKDSIYTPLFQMRLSTRDIKSNEPYPIDFSDYDVWLYCKNMYSNNGTVNINIGIQDSGIISYGGGYFSLKTDYVIDVSLCHDSDYEHILAQQTVDGPATDSNIVDIFFYLDNNLGTYQ